MMIIKEIPVYINILNSRIKKYFLDALRENGINMTPEQYLVMDIDIHWYLLNDHHGA